MKSKLKLHSIPTHTDEWYKFRQNGIGGSEMSTILGLNPYDTSIRLFHEKIGSEPQKLDDNESMFWGRTHEDNIARAWSYYDGTKDGYIENAVNNKIVRKCRKVNGYVVNPDYPWLFSSVDRLMNKDGGFNMITGQPLEDEGVLEIKTAGHWAYTKWEDGIPPMYIIQVHVYMIIFELNYAEIAMLVEGNKLKVESIERDEKLADQIINLSKQFWYDRVVPAKEAFQAKEEAMMENDYQTVEDNESIIQHCEPEPDGSEHYAQFMEDKFVEERDSIDGNFKLLKLAKEDRFLMSFKSYIDKKRIELKNQFIKVLTDHSASNIDFGRSGNVSWSERKGSKSRTFSNKLKVKPDEEYLEDQYSLLNPRFDS